jgi:transcription initiation factor IIE alpha subunit
MSKYPEAAGSYGLGGSDEAAKRITPIMPELQAKVSAVVEAAGSYGATGDEIAAALGWDKYRVRPRTSELRKLGRIIDSRKRRASQSGVMSIVWVLPCYSQPVRIGGGA